MITKIMAYPLIVLRSSKEDTSSSFFKIGNMFLIEFSGDIIEIDPRDISHSPNYGVMLKIVGRDTLAADKRLAMEKFAQSLMDQGMVKDFTAYNIRDV